MRKILVGLAACSLVYLLPAALGNPAALHAPQLWLLVGIGMFASLTQPAYKAIDRTGPPEDHGTSVQIVWTVYLTQLAGVLEAVFLRFPSSFAWDAVTTLGLVLAIGGAVFRAWAVSELGRFFTWHVRVQEGQKVVTSGPYRVVRHPSYTGATLLYVGALLFIHAWFAAAAALVLTLAAFSRRIRYEEGLLIRSLGRDYSDYCGRVKRLVPLVW